jgi:hypothetical protein
MVTEKVLLLKPPSHGDQDPQLPTQLTGQVAVSRAPFCASQSAPLFSFCLVIV